MNFKFSNLLGGAYRGGTLVLHGKELFSAVGNRICIVDLVKSKTVTLPFESTHQIQTICVSPDGVLVLVFDTEGRCLLINKRQQVLLHRISFKGKVHTAKFSPDGKFIAIAVGKTVQVWRSPGTEKVFAPMQQFRVYGGCHHDIVSLDWSDDSFWICVGSKDLTARIFTLNPVEGYAPPTLAGHKDTIVASFFAGNTVEENARLSGVSEPGLYTISKDGALFSWTYQHNVQPFLRPPKRQKLEEDGEDGLNGISSDSADKSSGSRKKYGEDKVVEEEIEDDAKRSESYDIRGSKFSGGSWKLEEKHYFNKRGAKLHTAAFHRATGMLVAGFSNGIFELFEMPGFSSIHTLSVSSEPITSIVFNSTGDWLALGCASLGQLLVWEWRSETYILKQQGHYYDISTLAYSPDGGYIATGAEDAKVKLWTPNNGFCFVTFTDHTGPVTGISFLPNSAAVVSCSLDGTVRAYDLLRYRNFRTMTTPNPQQFGCIAVDPSGEVIVAGSIDDFQLFVWSVKTARLLDILSAHEGPISQLAFSPTHSLLASASWDKTVRTWDIFSGKGALEVLQHNHDVLAVTFRNDGKMLASSTLDGQIYFWDPQEAVILGTIEGRRDIAGGRKMTDRRAAGNSSSGQCFRSLAFSADGSWLLAGGASKYVCLYDVAEKVMLRRFQISHNKSLDGVLDQLNSKNVTDAGPLDLIQDSASDDDDLLTAKEGGPAGKSDLPGLGNKSRALIRSRCVSLSPQGRQFACATTEGLLIYSLDDDLVFDPTDLGEDVTPQAIYSSLKQKLYLRALLLAFRLQNNELIKHTILSTPPKEVQTVVRGIPTSSLPKLLTVFIEALSSSPHIEFLLDWLENICIAHGGTMQKISASEVQPAMRGLQRSITQLYEALTSSCESNLFLLQYLSQAGQTNAELAS